MAACLVAASVPSALADTSGGGDIHPPGLPCGYTVEVIERPECPWPIPAQPMWVSGLNEHGTVVGYRQQCVNSQLDQAWIWQPGDTSPTDLDLPDHVVSSQAYDINDNGIVCGTYKDNPFITAPWLGFVYDTNTGEWTELEPVIPGSAGHAYANAINNAGVVAGTRSIGNTKQPYNAFTWSPDDGYTDLGLLDGNNTSGWEINAQNVVTGASGHHLTSTGFKWGNGDMITLEVIRCGQSSVPLAINDSGVIAGGAHMDQSECPELFSQATYWVGDKVHILPMEPDCYAAGANAINNAGLMAGVCNSKSGHRGLLWKDNNYVIIEEQLDGSFDIDSVHDISEDGEVLAAGNAEGYAGKVGFVLSPIETPLGDLNGDCEVNAGDLGLLLSEWGQSKSDADLTEDGTVGGADLGVLLSNWTTK